jgi:hypothetical protein
VRLQAGDGAHCAVHREGCHSPSTITVSFKVRAVMAVMAVRRRRTRRRTIGKTEWRSGTLYLLGVAFFGGTHVVTVDLGIVQL